MSFQIPPSVIDIEQHHFEVVRVVTHAASKIRRELYAGMLIPNVRVSSRHHLNHASGAGRTHGVLESVSLIQCVQRQNLRIDHEAIFIEKAPMIRVLDDDEMLSY